MLWAALFVVVICIRAGEVSASHRLISASGQRLRRHVDVNVDDEQLDFFRLPTKEEEDASFGFLEPHSQDHHAPVHHHTTTHSIPTDGASTLSLSKPTPGAGGLRMRMAEEPSLGKALVWGKPKAIPVHEHAYREVHDTVSNVDYKVGGATKPSEAQAKSPVPANPADRQKCTVVIPLPDSIPSAPVLDIAHVPRMCKVTVTCGGEDMSHGGKKLRRLLGADGSAQSLALGYGRQPWRRRLQESASDNALLKQLASRFEVLQQKMAATGATASSDPLTLSPEQRVLQLRLAQLERTLAQTSAAAASSEPAPATWSSQEQSEFLRNKVAELEARIRARSSGGDAVDGPVSFSVPDNKYDNNNNGVGSGAAVAETHVAAPAPRTSRGGFMRPDSQSIVAGIRMLLDVDEKHTCVGIKRACGDIGKRMALDLSKGSLKRCAVIGMSPNIKAKRYGPEIDAHDTVIRMDSMLIKGHEWHMGTKTTIAFIRNIMAGGVVKYNQPKSFFLYRSKSMRSPVGKYQGLPYASLQSLSGTTAADELYQKLLRFSLLPASGLAPSDSMVLVMALIHSELCTRIDLYGFDVETGSEANEGGSLTYNPGLEYFVYRVAMANNMLCVHDTAPYP
eukprot:jgi/Mesvir1/17106/Mv07541-RA.1